MINPDFVTLTDIEKLTGLTFKTIKKRIGDLQPEIKEGSSHFYSLRKVVPFIFAREKIEGLDLSQERANLAAKQAHKTDLIIQQMERDLIPTKDLEVSLNKVFTAIKAKCLLLPSKLTHQLIGLNSRATNQLLKETIHELLTELSTFDIDKLIRSDCAKMPSNVHTSSEVHGFDLGG